MPEEIRKSESTSREFRSPEGVLSFDVLLQHVFNKFDNPIQSIAIEACINESPLYRDAKDGLISFIQNEGLDALSDMFEEEDEGSFHELMIQIVNDELI